MTKPTDPPFTGKPVQGNQPPIGGQPKTQQDQQQDQRSQGGAGGPIPADVPGTREAPADMDKEKDPAPHKE